MDEEGHVPKIVNHDERRRELIEATWKVIARHGLNAVTMRQIAQEAGYANGALKPYFPTKSDLLEATYNHVFARTEERITAATESLRGLAALRTLCLEILPVTPGLLDEARIVVPFWEAAIHDPVRTRAITSSIDRWRDRITDALLEAAEDGELRPGIVPGNIAGSLLGFLQGSQLTAVVDPELFNPAHLREHLDAYLNLLRP